MIIFRNEDAIKTDIYNFRGMRSSFYNDVKYTDERKFKSEQFDRQVELERIKKSLSAPYRDDWDD